MDAKLFAIFALCLVLATAIETPDKSGDGTRAQFTRTRRQYFGGFPGSGSNSGATAFASSNSNNYGGGGFNPFGGFGGGGSSSSAMAGANSNSGFGG